MASKEDKISEEKMLTILETIYGKVLNGIPKVSKPIDQFVDDYTKFALPEVAAKKLINNQIAKCGTSGFIAGLGGIIVLPVTLPANITNVLYVQMRMVAAVAMIGGYDIYSDQVQTLVYACLTGTAITDVFKQAGIKAGEKFAVAAIKKIPFEVIKKINNIVGFKLLTKFGEKGVINLVKLVPIAGGIIGGALDIASTRVIAANAYKLFIKNTIPDVVSTHDTEEIFDAEYQETEIESDVTD